MYTSHMGSRASVHDGAYSRNESTQRLDLGSNRIAAGGCALLADGLMVNTGLCLCLQLLRSPPL